MPSRQLSIRFPNTWGGRRDGAGRPRGPRPKVAHRARPEHRLEQPVHLTLRSAFRPLRSRFIFRTLCQAIAARNERATTGFRIVHFSVQYDHVHFIVEAANARALSTGARGLAVSIARRVNSLVGRCGRFWADRWHGRALATPREVRAAIVYVLGNFRKHAPSARALVDRYSSALDFEGFREFGGRTLRQVVRETGEGLSAFTFSRAPPEAIAIVPP